ncbi:helix-turn-helix domain-containing protein [Kitasatospora sp. NPDC092286]|uniref:helix-turn-helix domain-containing protein n=1 Tax=Kitasatospora sp. NPDC092286 TaxID=3364087 RepID=UPI0037FE275A
MSIHLMLIAAYLPPDMVTPTEKLALMKICDSADDETRLSRPGLHRLAAWTGVSEKRTITLVTQLVEKGLVERIEVGKIGRTAVYRVFPLVLPTLPHTEELKERRRAASTAPRNPRLARPGVARSKPAAPARTYEDVDRREARAAEKRDGFPQGDPPVARSRVPLGEPAGFPQGNPVSSPGGTPFFPSVPTSVLPTPLPPTADAAGEAPPGTGKAGRACPRHSRVAKNCRACGTSARAGREAEEKRRREDAHRAEQARMADFLRDSEAQRQQARERSDDVQSARALAMEVARGARQRSRYNE